MKKKQKLIFHSFIFLILSGLIVLLNKADFKRATVNDSLGRKKYIRIPYEANDKDSNSLYTYDIRLHNSLFFSGGLHITPDDCIREISLNGTKLPIDQYPSGNCDYRNGFYVDLSKLLRNGENHLQLKILNTGGVHGLKISDTTFYEKYILAAYLLFLVCIADLKLCYRWIKAKASSLHNQHKKLLTKISYLLILFYLTLLMSKILMPSAAWFWPLAIQAVLIVGMPIGYWIFRNFHHGKLLTSIWVVMVLIFCCHLYGLSFEQFSYDFRGHTDYVKYVVSTGEVPVSDGGWSFYHPSLYYRSAAVVWNFIFSNSQMGKTEFFKSIQVCSLLMFMLYCYFSLKTINLFFIKLHRNVETDRLNQIQLLIAIMFLCWTSNSIVAVRVGNDVLFNLLFAMSFYFVLKWYHSEKINHLLVALFLSAMDVWAKTNGLILFGIIGSLMFFKIIRSRYRSEHIYKVLIFLSISLVTLYYTFNEKFEQYLSKNTTYLVVSNAGGLSDGLRVGAGLRNFTSFDLVSFVKIPFTSSYDDALGRGSFWFYLLKTSLFGEFDFDSPEMYLTGQILSFFLLAILAMVIYGFIISVSQAKTYLPVLIAVVLMLFSMIMFRISYPFSCASDFRYIYPTVLPCLLLMGIVFLRTSGRTVVFRLGQITCIAFALFSVLFQLLTILRYA